MENKKMDRLDIIYALTSILAIKESMKISVSELESSTNPKAFEYITGMKKHIEKMSEVYLTIRSMEEELKVLNRMNFNYHKQVMDLQFQIKDLRSENLSLKDQL